MKTKTNNIIFKNQLVQSLWHQQRHLKQPDLVKHVSAHGRRFGLDNI